DNLRTKDWRQFQFSVQSIEAIANVRFFNNRPDLRDGLLQKGTGTLPLLAGPGSGQPAGDAPVLAADDPRLASLASAAVGLWQSRLGVAAPPHFTFKVQGLQ